MIRVYILSLTTINLNRQRRHILYRPAVQKTLEFIRGMNEQSSRSLKEGEF